MLNLFHGVSNGCAAGDRRGVAAVEFAFIAPLLVIVLAAAVDLGFAVDRSIRLENAARVGAQYATQFPNDSDGIEAAVAGALGNAAGTRISISPLTCQCPTSTGESGTALSCTESCSTVLVRYRRIEVSQDFTPIFPTSALIPFNAIGATRANVEMRL